MLTIVIVATVVGYSLGRLIKWFHNNLNRRWTELIANDLTPENLEVYKSVAKNCLAAKDTGFLSLNKYLKRGIK